MENEAKGTVASLTKGKALSGLIIKAFFDGSDAKKTAERVAAAEGSRLQYLFRTFTESDVDTVRNAAKEYRDDSKKQYGEKSKEARVAKVRSMEVQALYGAWRFGEFKLPDSGIGYHPAVAAARETLTGKGIKWDGARIPEKWERDVRKSVTREAEVELAARMEIERTERTKGEPLTEQEETAIREKAKEASAKADMVTLARGLLKKYGAEKCGHLIDAMENAIHAEAQMAKDSAAAKQKAA